MALRDGAWAIGRRAPSDRSSRSSPRLLPDSSHSHPTLAVLGGKYRSAAPPRRFIHIILFDAVPSKNTSVFLPGPSRGRRAGEPEGEARAPDPHATPDFADTGHRERDTARSGAKDALFWRSFAYRRSCKRAPPWPLTNLPHHRESERRANVRTPVHACGNQGIR